MFSNQPWPDCREGRLSETVPCFAGVSFRKACRGAMELPMQWMEAEETYHLPVDSSLMTKLR